MQVLICQFYWIVFPVCKSGQITTYHVARGELIQVPCEIEAYPTDLIFHWSFNGSRDFADIPGSNYVADRLKSALSYRPVTDQVILTTSHQVFFFFYLAIEKI